MNPTQPTAPAGNATHTPTPYYNGSTNRSSANIVSADHVIAYVYDKNDRAFIVRACNSHAKLVAALDTLEADAVNLHCALQSTAHMDPRDSRIAAITGQVVEDLLAMRDKARAALTAAQS